MTKGTKLTLSDLLARKEQREKDQTEYKAVYVDCLDGELTLKKISLSRFLDMMGGIDEGTSPAEAMRAQAELIYQCCPLFQKKELQEAYECVEPTDVVFRVLDDNIMAISQLTAEIQSFYGMDLDDYADALKN